MKEGNKKMMRERREFLTEEFSGFGHLYECFKTQVHIFVLSACCAPSTLWARPEATSSTS